MHGGKRTQMIGRTRLASIALLAALWPAIAFAQGVSDGAKGVGVVTTIANSWNDPDSGPLDAAMSHQATMSVPAQSAIPVARWVIDAAIVIGQ